MDITTLETCLKARGDLGSIAHALVSHGHGMSGFEALPGVAAALRDPSLPFPDLVGLSSSEALYADGLRTLRHAVDWTSGEVRPDCVRSLIVSPVAHDELAQTEPVTGWGPIALLTHAALSLVKPRKRAAVVVTMRDDGISILEWVAHYRAIGFDAIFVYSNDNEDGSDALLSALADHGIITFIDNRTSRLVSPQRKAFAHSLHFLPELRDYEWVFYADSDELLVFGPEFDFSMRNVLHDVGRRFGDKLPSAICYHWKWFVSDFEMDRRDGLLLEKFQFTKDSPLLVKSIVRLSDVVSMRILHFPETLPDRFFIDSSLMVIKVSEQSDRSGMWTYRENQFDGGQINHYWCKSFAEFLIKKRRGDSLLLTEEENDYKREVALFFEWNGSSSGQTPDPPPARLVDRVKLELAQIRGLAGLAEAEAAITRQFPDIVQKSLGDRDLKAFYDEIALRAGLSHVGSTMPY